NSDTSVRNAARAHLCGNVEAGVHRQTLRQSGCRSAVQIGCCEVRCWREADPQLMDWQKFFRRRQFALGSDFLDFAGWTRTRLSNQRFLTIHPDLLVTRVCRAEAAVTALGYIIDPQAPDKTETQILSQVLEGISGP